MLKRRTGILFLFLMLLTTGVISAQQDEYITKVKLKDGSELEGKLTEYVDGEYIKMNIGDNPITIKHSSIKSIKHKSLGKYREYAFRENGFYHHTSVGLLPGLISSGNPTIGLELDHSSGYLFNRYFGAGLNVGLMNYYPLHQEVIYTLSAEARGYLLDQYFSPYYRLHTGYGFNIKGEDFLEADGGFFINPAMGIRLTGKKSVNITAEIGVNFQKAYYRYQTDWWDRSIIDKNVRYQRFMIKIGVLF